MNRKRFSSGFHPRRLFRLRFGIFENGIRHFARRERVDFAFVFFFQPFIYNQTRYLRLNPIKSAGSSYRVWSTVDNSIFSRADTHSAPVERTYRRRIYISSLSGLLVAHIVLHFGYVSSPRDFRGRDPWTGSPAVHENVENPDALS